MSTGWEAGDFSHVISSFSEKVSKLQKATSLAMAGVLEDCGETTACLAADGGTEALNPVEAM